MTSKLSAFSLVGAFVSLSLLGASILAADACGGGSSGPSVTSGGGTNHGAGGTTGTGGTGGIGGAGAGGSDTPVTVLDVASSLHLALETPTTTPGGLVATTPSIDVSGTTSIANAEVSYELGPSVGFAKTDFIDAKRWSFGVPVPVGLSTLKLKAKKGNLETVRAVEVVYYDDITFAGPPTLSPAEPAPGADVAVSFSFTTASPVDAATAEMTCENVQQSMPIPLALASNNGTAYRYVGKLTAPSADARCRVRGTVTLGGAKRTSLAAGLRVWPKLEVARMKELSDLHDAVVAAMKSAKGTFHERLAVGAALLPKAKGIAAAALGANDLYWTSVEGVTTGIFLKNPDERGGGSDYEVTKSEDTPASWRSKEKPKSVTVRPKTVHILRGTKTQKFKILDDEVAAKFKERTSAECNGASAIPIIDEELKLESLSALGEDELVYISSHGNDMTNALDAICYDLPGQPAFWIDCADPAAGSIMTADPWPEKHEDKVALFDKYGRSSLLWVTDCPSADLQMPLKSEVHVTAGFFLALAGVVSNEMEPTPRLKGSVVVLDVCSSARGSSIPKALIASGAAGAFGYRYPVPVSISNKLSTPMMLAWLDDGVPFADALFRGQKLRNFAANPGFTLGERTLPCPENLKLNCLFSCMDDNGCKTAGFPDEKNPLCYEETCGQGCVENGNCLFGEECYAVSNSMYPGVCVKAYTTVPVARLDGDLEGIGLRLVRAGTFEDDLSGWISYPGKEDADSAGLVGFEQSYTALGVAVTPPSGSGHFGRIRVKQATGVGKSYSFGSLSQQLITPRLADADRHLSFKYRIVAAPDVLNAVNKPYIAVRLDSKVQGNKTIWYREDTSKNGFTCGATACDTGWLSESVSIDKKLDGKVLEDPSFTIQTGHAPLPRNYFLFVDDVRVSACAPPMP